MLWKSTRNEYGSVSDQAVHLFECAFTTRLEKKDGTHSSVKANMKCFVICVTAEEAITACRLQWPVDFVLHQCIKRNNSADIIVVDSAVQLAKGTK